MDDLDELRKLIQQADELLVSNSRQFKNEFYIWEMNTERFLVRVYGKNSPEVKNFKGISFHLPIWFPDTPMSEFVSWTKSGIQRAKKYLEEFLKNFENNSSKGENDMS